MNSFIYYLSILLSSILWVWRLRYIDSKYVILHLAFDTNWREIVFFVLIVEANDAFNTSLRQGDFFSYVRTYLRILLASSDANAVFLRKFLTTSVHIQIYKTLPVFIVSQLNFVIVVLFVFRSLCDSLVLHLPCLPEVRWSQRPQTLRSRTIRNSGKGHRLVLPSKPGIVIDQLFKFCSLIPPRVFMPKTYL